MPEIEEQPTPKPRDFRQEVTDNIVALLEKGVAPWQKPWDAQSHLAMPVNPTTDRAYRGGNAVHLLAVGLQRNYDDPRWMTYKQASEQGWQVRRGEKGTQIEFWDVRQQGAARENGQNPEAPNEGVPCKDAEPASRLVHRVYTVFNARQMDGIPAYAPPERQAFEVAAAGERILKNSGAKISHDQADRAFYDRRRDEVHLPPQQAFKDAAGYYGTALHELGHWTGHPSRLDRWTLSENYKFGDTNYAKEELRAELASVFVAAEKGIPHDPQNHAAYVGSWIQALKQDKNEIFRAAHDASKAADLLVALERDASIADQDLDTSVAEPAAEVIQASQLERDREVLDEQPLEHAATRDQQTVTTGPFKPGDKVMAYEPYFYGGKPKPNPWTPAIVQSLYHNGEYISYARDQSENGNKAVEYAEKGEMHHASHEELARYAAAFAKVEEKLPQALREQMKANEKADAVTRRESTQTEARHEPSNGAVAITDKRNGDERRVSVAKEAEKTDEANPKTPSPSRSSDQFQEAMTLTAQLLGESAKTKPAQLIAGVHRGKIIGETSDLVLQRESPRSVVVHSKELFESAPKVGASVVVNYTNGTPSVREVKERGRSLSISR
ncbi:MAG TPA: zincin-like metallopeptidase domain-containing protein [Bryobacteraceae bacterium]|jgi:antirestriction protein ArdC|nr:zincin-like metallopeptidase domain-containing protein [Bryobacteraceae bacterium]